ncbi:MAG: hypothetical protein NC091_05540 [Bacteroides sp.]|nr:hypothetical protein [Bacteroides sp.]
MKEQYLGKVSTWYRNFIKYDVVLSDDVDGLISTSALKFSKNWDVEYFYDFEKFYIADEIYFKENKSVTRVWADVSVVTKDDEKTFDNHVNRVNLNDYTNPNAINPNIIENITNENYYDKYLGSTALLIWSLYNIPLPESELGKMILLAIDTAFKGFYGLDQYKRANKHFLCDVLGMEDLYEVLKRHSKNEFYEIIGKYNLNAKIRLNDEGYLETDLDVKFLSDMLGIPIQLPVKKMTEWRSLDTKFTGKKYFCLKSIKDIPRLATIAFTGKNEISYSVFKKKTA